MILIQVLQLFLIFMTILIVNLIHELLLYFFKFCLA